MAKIPVLKPREVVAMLQAIGFVEVRQRGAHKQFRHGNAGAQPCRFTKDAMSLPLFCDMAVQEFLRTPE